MRINVVVDSHAMNNWDVLGQGVLVNGGDYEVFFHRDPQMTIVDGATRFNFDIAIHDGKLNIDGMVLDHLLPSHRIHTIKRYNKVEQHTRIAGFLAAYYNQYQRPEERVMFKNFEQVKMWFNRQASGWSHLINPERPVVVKPRDGARGIGQFLINPNKIPMAVVIDNLDTFRRGTITGEQLMAALAKFDPDMAYSTEAERYPGEGLEAISQQGYTIQSFVPDIKLEYRLLSDKDGHIAYCQRRGIRSGNDGFPQATGSSTDSIKGDDVCHIKDVLSPTDLEGLEEIVRNVIGPLSSIDLYITGDEKWGIFEYCNQWGMKGVPLKLAQKLHLDFLHEMILKSGM